MGDTPDACADNTAALAAALAGAGAVLLLQAAALAAPVDQAAAAADLIGVADTYTTVSQGIDLVKTAAGSDTVDFAGNDLGDSVSPLAAGDTDGSGIAALVGMMMMVAAAAAGAAAAAAAAAMVVAYCMMKLRKHPQLRTAGLFAHITHE